MDANRFSGTLVEGLYYINSQGRLRGLSIGAIQADEARFRTENLAAKRELARSLGLNPWKKWGG